jgi:hypothetical protein
MTILLAGCSRSGASVGSGYAKAFQSADTQIKAGWESAMSALKTNGFAPAVLGLQRLKEQGKLTPEQLQAVEATVTAASDQMYAAANQGDAQARQAIEELRKAYETSRAAGPGR